jgi:AcrR family transcriptional regulator
MDSFHSDEQFPSEPNSNRQRLSIREEQKLMTRERLLDAAFEIFARSGFRNTTIDEIVKRAGATRATFYLHFNDKIDVAAGLGRRSGPAVARSFRDLDNVTDPTPEKIRAWVTDYFESRRESTVLNHVLNEAITSEVKFAQEYIEYLGRIADLVMVNTLGRFPEDRRARGRSKIILLIIMLQRAEFHVNCQNLDLGGLSAVEVLADMIWREMFTADQ